MSELNPSEQRLLDSLRAADEPTDADRDRVRSATLAKIALATGATTAAATTAKAAAGAAMSAGTVAQSTGVGALLAAHGKVAVAVVALAGVGAGAWWVVQAPPASAPAAPAPQATASSASRASAPPAVPEQPTEPMAPQQRAEPILTEEPATAAVRDNSPQIAGRPRPSADAKDLDREMRLIGAAQQAMRKGDPDRALRLLDEHASEHPSGVLAEERAGARAIALCKAGKTAEGRTAARRFLAKSPRSPLAARIHAACLEGTE